MAGECPITSKAGWMVVSLKDITTKIGSGATPRGGSENYIDARENFALVRSQNVFDRRFDSSGLAYITDEQAESLRGVALREGDVLLNITGDGITFGRACIVPNDVLPACVNQHVAIIRADPSKADPGFILSYLTNEAVKPYIEAFNAGGSRRAITKGHIESFRLPLPSLPEQRAIAHILGTLDDKIELNRRRNQTLEAMARALFKDWFVDFGPVRAKMEGHDAYLPADLWQLFPNRLDDEGKPEGWEMVPLDGFTSLETSSISPGKSPDSIFEHYSIPAFDAGRMPAMELGNSIKSNKYRVHTNAVLVSKLNPQTPRVWLPTIATDHAVCSTEFMQFVPRRPDDRPFLYCLMVSEVMEEEVLKHVTGSTGSRQRAQPSQIAKVEVLLPERGILSAFNRQAEPVLRTIADNQRESQTIAQLRDTLLPKLISGELRIADAERFVEEHAA